MWIQDVHLTRTGLVVTEHAQIWTNGEKNLIKDKDCYTKHI